MSSAIIKKMFGRAGRAAFERSGTSKEKTDNRTAKRSETMDKVRRVVAAVQECFIVDPRCGSTTDMREARLSVFAPCLHQPDPLNFFRCSYCQSTDTN